MPAFARFRLVGSRTLLPVALLLVAVAAFEMWYVGWEMDRMEADAASINQTGTVRGAIQRIAKRTLAGVSPDDLITQTRNTLEVLLVSASSQDAGQVTKDLLRLREVWSDFVAAVRAYRSAQTPSNRRRLMAASEAAWEVADTATATAQFAAEQRLRTLRTGVVLNLANVVMGLLIVWWILGYVRGRLEYNIKRDHLTNLHNRALFDDLLEYEVYRSHRYGNPLSLVLFDIDNFKNINDRFGHHEGDAVLRRLGEMVNGGLRASDVACRIGGEEFAIIAPETGLDEARRLGEKLRRTVATCRFGTGPVTVSVGVAALTPDERGGSLLQRADRALYAAKRGGRNRVVVADGVDAGK